MLDITAALRQPGLDMPVLARFGHVESLLLLAVSTLGCAADPSAEGVASSESPVTICPMATVTPGIDVSRYSGAVDWVQVKASGRLFGIARIGDGTTLDSTFATHWRAMKAAGVIRGGYLYFRPSRDAALQADLVVSAVGVLGPGDLPVVLDVEDNEGLTPAVVATQLTVLSNAVSARTGKMPIIYTGPYFWDQSVGSTAFASNPLWVAHWGVSCPNLPAAWNRWVFWQFTSSDQVAGVSGAVDGDRFNGDRTALETFAGIGAAGAAGAAGSTTIGSAGVAGSAGAVASGGTVAAGGTTSLGGSVVSSAGVSAVPFAGGGASASSTGGAPNRGGNANAADRGGAVNTTSSAGTIDGGGSSAVSTVRGGNGSTIDGGESSDEPADTADTVSSHAVSCSCRVPAAPSSVKTPLGFGVMLMLLGRRRRAAKRARAIGRA